MNPSHLAPPVRSHAQTSRQVALIALLLLSLVGTAFADTVTTMIGNLSKGADYKIRLSAAIGLSNQGDPRAVAPMTAALADSDKNVRAAAASGLAKLVVAKTSAKEVSKALAELDRLAKSDPAKVVKTAASKAATAIRALSSGGASTITKGGIYIDVQPVAAGAGVSATALLGRMEKTAKKTIGKQSVMTTTVMASWPGGAAPSAANLTANAVDGFQVTSTLVSLTSVIAGANATVKCEVKVVLATFPAASMFGFLNSSAAVQGSSTAADITAAGEDCVDAVIEGLMKKVIGTIKTRTGKP